MPPSARIEDQVPPGALGFDGAGDSRAQLERHAADLLRQCPSRPRLSPDEEAAVPIHVTRWGTTGRKILAVHGGEQAIAALGGGPKNFAGQKSLGEQGWQLRVPDRPGFGKSPSRGCDDMIADVRWIVAMLRESGGSHLWGHSFGGAEGLLAAAEAPEVVRSLVLIEPNLWSMADVLPPAQVPAAVAEERASTARALADAETPAAFASAFLRRFQPDRSGWKVHLTRQALRLVPGLRKRIGCGLLQAREADGVDFLRAAEAVKKAGIPVLVITGGWSRPHDALGDMVAHGLLGTHAIVPSVDHIVMRRNPSAFNRTVTRFMETVPDS